MSIHYNVGVFTVLCSVATSPTLHLIKLWGTVYVLENALLFINLNEWHKQSTQYRGVVLKCLQVACKCSNYKFNSHSCQTSELNSKP